MRRRPPLDLPLVLLLCTACGPDPAPAGSSDAPPEDRPDGAQDTNAPDTGTQDTGSDPAPDVDGDGWAADEDCDDADPALHPGADELCDGVDQDCDGSVDEDAVDGVRVAAWSGEVPATGPIEIALDGADGITALDAVLIGHQSGHRDVTTAATGGALTVTPAGDLLAGERLWLVIPEQPGVCAPAVLEGVARPGPGGGTWRAPRLLTDLNSAYTGPITGDLDGDGLDDAAFIDWQRDSLVIWRSAGGGSTETRATSETARTVGMEDVDGDGDLDLLLLDLDGDALWVHANDGAGGLGDPAAHDLGHTHATWAGTLDLGGDGDPDVVLLNSSRSVVWSLVNDGDGAFSVQADVAVSISSLATPSLGDVDADGDLDLLVTQARESVTVLVNGGGGLTVDEVLPLTDVVDAALFHLDGDGRADLAATTLDGTLHTWTTQSDGTFTAGSSAALWDRGTPQIQAVDRTGAGVRDLVVYAGREVWAIEPDAGADVVDWRRWGLKASHLEEVLATGDTDGDGVRELVVAETSYDALLSVPNLRGGGLAVWWWIAGSPYDLKVADFDGDTIVDGMVTGTDDALALWGSGGDFSETAMAEVLEYHDLWLSVDLDNNGHPDLLTRSLVGDEAAIGLVESGRVVGDWQVQLLPEHVTTEDIGDLNADGTMDVVVGSLDGDLQVFAGDAAGGLVRTDDVSLSGELRALRLVDVDGDHDLDVVVGVGAAPPQVLLGDGQGRLADPAPADGAEGGPFYELFADDLDSDGHPDLLALASEGWQIYRGDGAGAFTYDATATATLAGLGSDSDALGDVSGDGTPDLVTVTGAGDVVVLHGDGAGGFVEAARWGTGTASALQLADADGDGDLDLFYGSLGGMVVAWQE